jgi:hypothetical protein
MGASASSTNTINISGLDRMAAARFAESDCLVMSRLSIT